MRKFLKIVDQHHPTLYYQVNQVAFDLWHDFCSNLANKSCRQANCFIVIYDSRSAAISRAFLLILRPRFSEPAIDKIGRKFYFFQNNYCAKMSIIIWRKFYFSKRIIFFLWKGLIFVLKDYFFQKVVFANVYKYDFFKQVLYFERSIFVLFGTPYVSVILWFYVSVLLCFYDSMFLCF